MSVVGIEFRSREMVAVIDCATESFESGALARGVGKKRGRRAFRCKVCDRWHLGKSTKRGPVAPKDDPQLRTSLRRAHGLASGAQRREAVRLNVWLREPPPNEAVRAAQSAAAKQRQNAMVAASSKAKRQYLARARDFDGQAARARVKQLDGYWSELADTETETLADLRGDDLIMEQTEVPDWARDDNGALERDDNGLPKLVIERAKARRKKHGLKLLLEKGARAAERGEIAGITKLGYDTGVWFGQLCSDAAAAEIGSREETGIPAPKRCRSSPGPADWKLDAVLDKKRADASVMRIFPGSDGEALLRLLVDVCYNGRSVHSLASGVEAVARAESRVATGLAILRQHQLTPRPKRQEVAA